MEKMPNHCYAGRVLFGGGGLNRGLQWQSPCPVPAECVIAMTPPLYFCVGHYDAVMDHLHTTFERLGMIDRSVVGLAPVDEFDEMMLRLHDEQ